jgi:hypothetical protein
MIPVGLFLVAIAEYALRGSAAESEDERVEAVTVAGGVLALADRAREAHRVECSAPRGDGPRGLALALAPMRIRRVDDASAPPIRIHVSPALLAESRFRSAPLPLHVRSSIPRWVDVARPIHRLAIGRRGARDVVPIGSTALRRFAAAVSAAIAPIALPRAPSALASMPSAASSSSSSRSPSARIRSIPV